MAKLLALLLFLVAADFALAQNADSAIQILDAGETTDYPEPVWAVMPEDIVPPEKVPHDLAAERGVLLVFTRPDFSDLDAHFRARDLPRIKAACKAMDIPVQEVDARMGTPKEITITPCLVYQNYKGRSIYEGRYKDISRIAEFVKTARAKPFEKSKRLWKNTLIWNHERTRVIMPLSMEYLAGTPPEGFKPETFLRLSKAHMAHGFARLYYRESLLTHACDRIFPVHVTPTRDINGRLIVTAELYSQYDLQTPLFRTSEPYEGPWWNRKCVLARLAQKLESQLIIALRTRRTGDGFDVMRKYTRVCSWHELGLDLPAPPGSLNLASIH
jgi:hypothetical protein